jgi:hypothetical protein
MGHGQDGTGGAGEEAPSTDWIAHQSLHSIRTALGAIAEVSHFDSALGSAPAAISAPVSSKDYTPRRFCGM